MESGWLTISYTALNNYSAVSRHFLEDVDVGDDEMTAATVSWIALAGSTACICTASSARVSQREVALSP